MKRQRDARFWLGLVPAALLVLAFIIPVANATLPVSGRERARLDDLNAADVAATYLSTTRDPVRRYISAPSWDVRINDLDQLLGLREVQVTELSEYPATPERSDWPDQRLAEVRWESRLPDSVGEPAGDQQIFVLVGRKSAGSPWKVLALGTMF